jgi:hypothetical protein
MTNTFRLRASRCYFEAEPGCTALFETRVIHWAVAAKVAGIRFWGRSVTMLPDTIRKQAVAIGKTLCSHGWAVAEVEQPFENEWWAAEIWRIESKWAPQGVHAYLTFLVDPQGGPGDVWAVCASPERPSGRPTNSGLTMRLTNVWQQELPVFVNGLSQFRVQSPENKECPSSSTEGHAQNTRLGFDLLQVRFSAVF